MKVKREIRASMSGAHQAWWMRLCVFLVPSPSDALMGRAAALFFSPGSVSGGWKRIPFFTWRSRALYRPGVRVCGHPGVTFHLAPLSLLAKYLSIVVLLDDQVGWSLSRAWTLSSAGLIARARIHPGSLLAPKLSPGYFTCSATKRCWNLPHGESF